MSPERKKIVIICHPASSESCGTTPHFLRKRGRKNTATGSHSLAFPLWIISGLPVPIFMAMGGPPGPCVTQDPLARTRSEIEILHHSTRIDPRESECCHGVVLTNMRRKAAILSLVFVGLIASVVGLGFYRNSTISTRFRSMPRLSGFRAGLSCL